MTKTIRAFEGPHLRLMFYKFDDEEATRLNKGVRGRLIEHCKYLLREKNLKGYDANEIYENTCLLTYEGETKYDDSTIDMRESEDDSDVEESPAKEKAAEEEDEVWSKEEENESPEVSSSGRKENSKEAEGKKMLHELPFMLRNYLEKIRYFN